MPAATDPSLQEWNGFINSIKHTVKTAQKETNARISSLESSLGEINGKLDLLIEHTKAYENE